MRGWQNNKDKVKSPPQRRWLDIFSFLHYKWCKISKEYTPKEVALIELRGVLKCICNNQQFSGVLEYWSDGVMEDRRDAFFLPEQITEKRKIFKSYSLF